MWAQIDRVIDLMRDFRIVIHDNCKQLLSDVGSYRRKMVHGLPTESIENKDAFHMADCLRYGVAYLAGPREKTEVVDRFVSIGPRW